MAGHTATITQRTATLVSLPMELHLRIQRELFTDPDTTFDDYKSLRLVCKTFDLIWSPIVLSRFSLLPLSKAKGDNILNHFHQVSHSLNSGCQSRFTALTFAYWGCLNSDLHAFFDRLKLRGYSGGETWGPILILIQLLILTPVFLLMFLTRPKDLVRNLTSAIDRIRARHYVDEMSCRLQLPNIRCAWFYYYWNDSRWAIYKSTRMLLSLPHLPELELYLSWTADMPYISECLSDLCTLRKFALYIHPESLNNYLPPQSTSCFSALIERNPGLTHLRLASDLDAPFDFAELLSDVYTPLKLEHLSIDSNSTNLNALIPHLTSLISFEFHSRPGYYVNTWSPCFIEASIFPPKLVINTHFLDTHLISYLQRHPGIESLSIDYTSRPEERHDVLSQILALHSKTLRYLAIPSHMLAVMLRSAQNKVDFVKCANLSELVLLPACGRCVGIPLFEIVDDEKEIFPLISHLDSSLTVVIRSREIERFQDCLKHCRDSQDPSVRHLTRRIVYEKYDDWRDHFRTFQWRPELYKKQSHGL